MHSRHTPERLSTELQSTVGPSLASKGYRMVGSGPSGVTWRRQPGTKEWVGVVILGLLALGSFASGEVGTIFLGVAFAAAAVALFIWRRPGTVTVGLTRGVEGGSEITVEGNEADRVTGIVKTTASITDN
jgi:hypothetical protein